MFTVTLKVHYIFTKIFVNTEKAYIILQILY